MKNISSLIPESFLEKENREGYVVSSEMKAVWLKQLELLYTFDKVCQKHDIHYSVIAGTLLGAVRHNGYIPWDDDIDVLLSRVEYEKLCKIAPKEFHDPFFFQTEYTDPGSFRLHAQLRNSSTTAIIKNEVKYHFKFNQGIFIDIFPLDVLSNNKFVRTIDKIILHNLWRISFYTSTFTTRYHYDKNQKKWKFILHKILLPINKDQKFERLIFRQFENYLCRHKVGDYCYIYALASDRFVWKTEWFNTMIRHKFEFFDVEIPKEYKMVLTQTYGNWEKKVMGTTVHGNILYDTNVSYKEYLAKL